MEEKPNLLSAIAAALGWTYAALGGLSGPSGFLPYGPLVLGALLLVSADAASSFVRPAKSRPRTLLSRVLALGGWAGALCCALVVLAFSAWLIFDGWTLSFFEWLPAPMAALLIVWVARDAARSLKAWRSEG